VSVDPGKLESLSMDRERATVARDHGWTSDGRIWVGAQLSYQTLSDGRLYVPAGLLRFLGSSYQIRDHGKWNAGELKLAGSHLAGLRPYLGRREAEVGDWLLAVFSLPEATASLYLGEEDVLEDVRSS